MASGIRSSGKPTIDIGKTFSIGPNGEAIRRFAAYSRHVPRVSRGLAGPPASGSGVFLGLENLTALVHAGLQVEVVRTAQFAGILVLGIGRFLKGIGRTAHPPSRRRCFSTGNGHIGIL